MKHRFISTMLLILGLIAASVMVGANTVLAADDTYNLSYEALLEVHPDDICWPDGDMNGNASFVNGVLIINSGTSIGTLHSYGIEDPDILVSPAADDPWIIEINAKFGQGGSSHNARSHMQVVFSPYQDDDYMNALQIGEDEFFLLSTPLIKGATSTTRDTDGSYHTYTIKLFSDNTIEVFYDDEATAALTGNLVDWSPYGSLPKRLYFGDNTGSSSGTSYWNYVKFSHYNGICGIFLP